MIRIHKISTELRTGSLVRLEGGPGVLAYGRFNRTSATIVVINATEYETISEISVEVLGIPEEAKVLRVMESTKNGYKTEPLNYYIRNGKLVRAYGANSAVVMQYNKITAINEESFWSTNFFRV
jgi:alpha-glucosidase